VLDYLFGREACKSREEGNPAVALLDLNLPKLTSSSASRALKRY
jgi:hypothetical protein